ncbi:MAG TPA: translocation/assembly module TamB domain-containing protein [Polyangiaceae bacterium]
MAGAARALAKGLGTAVVFVAALAAGAVAHMDVPAVRRTIVARVNQVLASALAGRVVLDRVGRFGPTSVADVDAHVDDPEGKTVLRVSGLEARVATWDLLRSLASGPDVRVAVDEVSIVRADVSLDGDDTGQLRLARAFASPPTSTPTTGGGGGVRLTLPHARLAHVELHGRPPAGPLLEAYVDGTDASVRVTPGKVALEVAHALIAERDLSDGMTTLGVLDARYEQPAADGSDRFAHASWRGIVGALAGTAEATYDAGRIDAVVDVPATRPECVRDLWAACPFGEPASAHAEVHGALPHLFVSARGAVGAGAVTASGLASVGEEVRASLHVTATSIDAHALAPSAPATELAMSGDVLIVSTATGPAGAAVALDFAGGTVAGATVPRARITGQVGRDAAGSPPSGAARVEVREPGAPATATLLLVPSGSSFQIGFDASVDAPRLEAIPRLGPAARGSAKARARGSVDLGKGTVDARVEASAANLAAGGATLRAASLEARATGPLAAPSLDATVAGSTLVAGSLRFDDLKAQVKGTPANARAAVSMRGHGADVDAHATVGLVGGTTLRDLAITIQRNGESARAAASLVRVTARETSLDDLVVEGLGSPMRATVRLSPGTLTAKARSRGLDLARLGKLAGVPGLGGRVSLDVDASVRSRAAEGHVTIDLTQGTFGSWKDATAHVEATLDGLHAAGHATGGIGGVGTFDVSSTSLQIGAAGPLEGSAWRTAWGEVDLAAHVDLAKLYAQLPKGALPFGNLAGTVDVKGRVERDSASDTTPEVDLTAATSGLAVVGSPRPWRLEGIGATVHAHVDGRTGATAVDATLADAGGPLVALQASSQAVPYGRLFTADEPIRAALLAMPVAATVTLPAHDVARLPAFLGTRDLEGTLAGTVEWRGSVEAPTVDVRATLSHGRAETSVLALPVDVAVSGHYDGAHADVTLLADAKGQPVLEAGGGVDLRMADVLGGGELPWKASAHAKLTDFPLQSLAALDDRQVRGLANGTFRLDDLHENPKASVALTLTELQVGEIACRPTTFAATADGRVLEASARIVEQDGYAEAKAHVGSHWGNALLPSPDVAQAADVQVTAKNFRAAVLLPFVSQYFTELDGRLDGQAHLLVDPAAKTVKPEGTLALSGGIFELSAMGSELHDASARISFTPDGLVRLDQASARGLTGRIAVAATARLQGLELVGAHAVVQVPAKEPLPLVIDGTQVGMVDGKMDVVVTRAADALDVQIDVPGLRVQLPESSSHSVQSLDTLADVSVGVARPGGEFVPLVLDAGDTEAAPQQGPRTPTRVTARLHDVEVRRGNDLDIHMDGTPVVTLADAVTAKGQIRLTRGTLDVKGKTFTLDEGSTVTFVEDPTNPQVVLTASWVAPSSDPSSSGTTVFADFVGPLRTGKVTLRSEPPLARTEILSLLLYGTTDQGGAGSGGSQQVTAATGVAGGAASANINRALGGVNSALDRLGLETEVSTKLDTSEATPRPEVELQIARDLTFQIAWVLGVPPPGTNPDATLFTLSYHFLRNWQAETTRGDAGTTILDLVWQRRY